MILQQVRRGLVPFMCMSSWMADVIFFGIPITSLGLACVVAPIYGVRWLLHLRKGKKALRSALPLLLKGGLCLLTFGAATAMSHADIRIAEARAQQIFAAAQEYRARNGTYPSSLDALVPEFLDRVPRCCVRRTMSDFFYDASADSHNLWWLEAPPFGRRGFYFEEQRYWSLD